MGPGDVTSREAVLRAMQEYDEMGREAFLAKYGFSKSRKFVVSHNGREYDSKALLAAAHGVQHPDQGPLPNNFSGGEQTTSRLRALEFTVTSPAVISPGVSFTAEDCEVFQRYPKPVHWDKESVDPVDQAIFKSIRSRLKTLVGWLADNTPVDIPIQGFTSLYQANGFSQPIIWCCIYPATAPNKSYALQVALIISARGAEVCLCIGAGRSQLQGSRLVEAEQALRDLQARMASIPPAVIDALDNALPSNAAYCKSWRKPTGTGDFQTLRQWLAYAASPDGTQASISLYLDVDELERLGDQIAEVSLDLATAAAPLFEYCYLGQVTELPPPQADRPRTVSLQGKPWAGCARCGHPWQLHSNGRTPCRAVGCRRGPDGAPCPGFVTEPRQAAPTVPLTFDADSLRKLAAAAPYELELDEQVYRAIIAAICSGKHVILTGPPGTAKTTLAELTCQLAGKAERCSGYTLTTATADWTTYETIGGLRPASSDGSLEFREGLFLETIQAGRWLIIDELNRSNFDRAFGQLFTVLSGQSVVLPYETPDGRRIVLSRDGSSDQYNTEGYACIQIPESWRIVATMNVFDKSLLFEMSFALMRRFAFIEVPSPEHPVFADLWRRKLEDVPEEQAERIEQVLNGLLGLTSIKDIGPAVFIDMAMFSREYFGHRPQSAAKELAFQLFYSYLLPQFEGITKSEGQKLFTKVMRVVGEPHRQRLHATLTDVLGITFDSRQLPAEGEVDEGLQADWDQGSLLLPGEA